MGRFDSSNIRFAPPVMRAIGSGMLVGLAAASISACGGDSRRHRQTSGNAAGMAEAGAASIEEGSAGAEHGGAGSGTVEEGGDGGKAARGGAGGLGMSGGSGTPGAGGMSAAGAGAGGAGASAAGAPGGGAASGGASPIAGAGNANLMEAPPNCQAVRQSADAETCAYEYACDALTHFDSCRLDTDGIWACECGTFADPTRYFEIEGVEGLEACGVIARVCESDVPVGPTRTCRVKAPLVDAGTCSADATCGNALDLGPGIVARAVEPYRAECKPTADAFFTDGGFDCSCLETSIDRDPYQVTAPSIEAVCAPMLGFCMTEEPPVFSGRVCGDLPPAGSVDELCRTGPDCQGCTIFEQCGGGDQLDPDVSIVDRDNIQFRYIVCRGRLGGLHCTCEMTPEGLYNDDSVPAAILQVCSDSRAVCPR